MGFWHAKQGGKSTDNINRRDFVMVDNLIVNMVSTYTSYVHKNTYSYLIVRVKGRYSS